MVTVAQNAVTISGRNASTQTVAIIPTFDSQTISLPPISTSGDCAWPREPVLKNTGETVGDFPGETTGPGALGKF